MIYIYIYISLLRIPIFPNKGNLSSVEAKHYRTYIQHIAASRSILPVCSTSERRKRFYESRDNNTIMHRRLFLLALLKTGIFMSTIKENESIVSFLYTYISMYVYKYIYIFLFFYSFVLEALLFRYACQECAYVINDR